MKKLLLILTIPLLMGASCTVINGGKSCEQIKFDDLDKCTVRNDCIIIDSCDNTPNAEELKDKCGVVKVESGPSEVSCFGYAPVCIDLDCSNYTSPDYMPVNNN